MTGRPSSYNEAVADEICQRIAEGEGLRAICRDERMPGRRTVLDWLDDDRKGAFRTKYARAREAQADFWDEEMHNEAQAAGPDTVHVARLRIDTMKWRASKLAPKKYGDRIEVEQTVEHRFVARIPEPAANASEWLADQRPKQIEVTAVSSPHGETGEKISKPR